MRKIPLLDYHREMGAEIGEFAGWSSPLWFTSNRDEHLKVRSEVGLFDITHMTRIRIAGSDSERLLQMILTKKVEKIKPGRMKYCLICRDDGGIMDDVTVFRHSKEEKEFIMVSNAITHDKIIHWLESNSKNMDVEIEDLTFKTSLFAIQGPKSSQLTSKLVKVDVSGMKWFSGFELKLNGLKTILTRSGYTGENGYELMIWSWDENSLKKIWEEIVDLGAVPCGLATRDSLRIEAGYPLYGQDMSEEVTPVEARLMHAVDLSKPNFIGREAIEERMRLGVEKLLVGVLLKERGVPRRGYRIFHGEEVVGELTSGTLSYSLGVGVGLGYIKSSLAKEGEEILIEIHGRKRMSEVKLTPFVPWKIK
ncbi:MAG: glycine cleavage system aminomethyltransferase GcvT [Thaumarchaeota archaeon]|nr:MAG: glycine cleavage system aminomethyltransferase GcvT [Nitrososphaerota archaeon]